MAHFTKEHNFNLYRLPVAWQYLVNNVLGGTLEPGCSAHYDMLVQACLATGSHCLIDVHNYARWNGGIIGQGGPTNEQFANLWSQLATKYASESKVMFGLMNEPHDLPDLNLWAESVQCAVTAIRQAGATSQVILLPGNDYTSAGSFVSGGSAAALCNVTNLDGTVTNLIFDVHKYLDSDGSGTHAECVSNQIDASFSPLATYLRANNRQALLSETGGGSSNSDCMVDVCQALRFLDSNSDVYLGYIGWAAGAFSTDYILSLRPLGSAADGWTDQQLLSCFTAGAAGGGSYTVAPLSTASSSTSATSLTAATTLVATVTVSLTSSAPSSTSFAYSFGQAPTYASFTSTTFLSSATSSAASAPSTTSFAYSFGQAPTYASFTSITFLSSATSSTASAPSTTSFAYSFGQAPTDASLTPTTFVTSTAPSAASASSSTASASRSSTSGMYPSAQTAHSSGFTTLVQSSSTETAGALETADGTCVN
ncbi:hypothetical protein MMC13_003599 [Lambiella insularis]|nr:hypothetical protein [Lambiella insularis]